MKELIIFASGVVMGAWLVDSCRNDVPLLPDSVNSVAEPESDTDIIEGDLSILERLAHLFD